MNVTIPTIVAFLMSSIISPLFEKYEIPLTAAQQAKFGTWLTMALMLVVTVATHFAHKSIKAARAARAIQPAGTAESLADIDNSLPPPVPSSATSIGRTVSGKPIAAVFAVLLLMPLLHGCALLANPTFDLVLQAAIQAAVDAVLARNPAAAQVLVTDATTLAGIASGTTTTAALQTQADNVIAASPLSTGDKQAIEDLVAAAAGLLQQESAKIPANAQSGLQLVFTDIANAAQLEVLAGKAVGAHSGAIFIR